MKKTDQPQSWYDELRQRYRPNQITLLLIGESAPEQSSGERRFFYAPTLTRHDNLFRGVVQGLYDHVFPDGSSGLSKVPWLERLKSDGVFLVDVVPHPVNHLTRSMRRRLIRKHAPEVIDQSSALSPVGIVICHGPTFDELREGMMEADLPLLHSEPLPFPIGNWRRQFASMLDACTSELFAR